MYRGHRSVARSSAWPRSWRPQHRWPSSTCSSSTIRAVRRSWCRRRSTCSDGRVRRTRVASPQFRWRLEWAVRRGIPLEVTMTRADRAPGLALREWARPPYDVVWFSTRACVRMDGTARPRPDHRGSDGPRGRQGPAPGRICWPSASDRAHRADPCGPVWPGTRPDSTADDWRRFQRSVAAQVERVVVPSDVDAARSGLPNVEVIPNTYPRPQSTGGEPVGLPAPGRPLPGEPRTTPPTSTGRSGWHRHRSPHPGHRSGDRGTTGRPAGHQRQVAPPARGGDGGGPGPLHG